MSLDKIATRLRELKRQTEEGFYAPITDVTENDSTLIFTLDHPNGNTGEYRISIPNYWESGRELVEFLRNIDVGLDNFEEITNRAIPVTRVNSSWTVDEDRLDNSDYQYVSPILTFTATDTTQNNKVSFNVEYDVVSDNIDRLELTYDNQQNDRADETYTLSSFSGTHSEYSEGGATGDYTITLTGLDSDGNIVFEESTEITATN